MAGNAHPTPLRDFDSKVFVNCPFDAAFEPLFHAILFTIHDCGFRATYAVEDAGGREQRLSKIVRLIDESRYSIHDLSRVQLDKTNKLPRFNMPFECGLAWGAMNYGGGKGRDALVMTGDVHQDKKSISDLAGIDPGYHGNDCRRVIESVRRFLARKNGTRPTRGAASIATRLADFERLLPAAVKSANCTLREIKSLAYTPEWVSLAYAFIVSHP
jgi:hypothetical protein